MIGKVFPARNHPWLAKGGEPHRLGFVELGVLEGRQPKQAIQHARGQTLLLDIEKVGADNLNSFRKGSHNGELPPLLGRR